MRWLHPAAFVAAAVLLAGGVQAQSTGGGSAGGGTASQETPAPQPAPTPAPLPAPAPSSAQTANYFNPAISVIGNFLAVGGSNRIENLPSASLRESELGLQAVVDPYARADFFLSFGEEGVDVEEGFITFTSLPADFLVKLGRMRVAFGKINTLHLHVLPWPDEPLPIADLLGGAEGWIGSGVSVAKLLPLPGDTFSELTLQILRGDGGPFIAPTRTDLAYNGHYRVFRDLSDSTNLDVGLSYAIGANSFANSTRTSLGAVDFTLRWKPLRRASYRSMTVRGELIFSRLQRYAEGAEQANGWFASCDYQLAKRWVVGARAESTGHSNANFIKDKGLAALLTFSPSEFSQLRAEVRHRRLQNEIDANEILLQVQFAIGAHGAHPF